MAGCLAGIDIGGTFTDCVVIDTGGQVTTAKAPSTPPDFSQGIVDALGLAAERMGLPLPRLCESLELVSHGTTVGTNALIQKRGARVGLLTTRGHEHAIHIMRGSRGLSGRDIRKVVHFSEGLKPAPLVPKSMVRGLHERVDVAGTVLVPLERDDAIRAIDALVADGAEAIAICLLWSFKNPSHELIVQELVRERHPGLFVTCSAELAPKWGEYERTTAVVLNAYIGPQTVRYLRNIDGRLHELGYRKGMQITQCGGGTISVERAMAAPLLTLDSGPVAGVTASAYLGAAMNEPNLLTTDMGGTSFDVGLVHGGEPASLYKSSVHQYEYFLPKVDIQAIGAGGGSIATADAATGTLRVGPESAGSSPGPVCYGRGGTQPTVTDAALVLGYLDPDAFAGGRMRLDRDAARAAVARLGESLGMSVDQCAAGICSIVEFRMADIIRRTTVEKGHDPRDFTLLAFGGAGPAHAGVFAREAEVRKVLIPQRKTAAVWCAFGAAAADVLHVLERAELLVAPFDPTRFGAVLRELRARGEALLERDGLSADGVAFSVDLRHRGQINEVEVTLPSADLVEADLGALAEEFYRRYDALYGQGASFRGIALEAVTFRCRVRSATPKPRLRPSEPSAGVEPLPVKGERLVFWTEHGERRATLVVDGDRMRAGQSVDGPAVVETADTSVVVRPQQALVVDAWGNFELRLRAQAR